MHALVLGLLVFAAACAGTVQNACAGNITKDAVDTGRVFQKTGLISAGEAERLKKEAESHVAMKRYHAAIEIYERLMRTGSGDLDVIVRLAELNSWLGNFEKSIAMYRDARKAEPSNLHIATGLAKVLRWSNRYEESAELYREVLESDPDNHDALKGLSKCFSRMGALQEAGRIIEQAIKLYPQDRELYKEKGNIHAWQKNYNTALEALKKAVDLYPNYEEAYVTMGDVYYWMKSYKDAIQSYKRAIAINPDNDSYHVMLAKAHLEGGNRFLSAKHLNISLNINPANAQARELLNTIEGRKWYAFIEEAAHLTEFITYVFIMLLLFINFRRSRRLLKRKHKIYIRFTNIVLPSVAFLLLVMYVGQGAVSRWLNADAELIHSISESSVFLLFGMAFLSFLVIESRAAARSSDIILAIGAHPDDIELGCGGFLMKSKDSGALIYGLVVSRGEKGNSIPKKRDLEQMRASEYLGLDGLWVLDFPDTKLKDNILPIKEAIHRKIQETGANIILTHSSVDIHSDHKAVLTATKEAAKNSSVVLSYEDVCTPGTFIPNYYVDIGRYIKDKTRLISFHRSQEHKTYMDPEVIKGRAAHRGLQSGLQYAEAFRVHQIIQ